MEIQEQEKKMEPAEALENLYQALHKAVWAFGAAGSRVESIHVDGNAGTIEIKTRLRK